MIGQSHAGPCGKFSRISRQTRRTTQACRGFAPLSLQTIANGCERTDRMAKRILRNALQAKAAGAPLDLSRRILTFMDSSGKLRCRTGPVPHAGVALFVLGNRLSASGHSRALRAQSCAMGSRADQGGEN